MSGRRPLLYSFQASLPHLPIPSIDDTIIRVKYHLLSWIYNAIKSAGYIIPINLNIKIHVNFKCIYLFCIVGLKALEIKSNRHTFFFFSFWEYYTLHSVSAVFLYIIYFLHCFSILNQFDLFWMMSNINRWRLLLMTSKRILHPNSKNTSN